MAAVSRAEVRRQAQPVTVVTIIFKVSFHYSRKVPFLIYSLLEVFVPFAAVFCLFLTICLHPSPGDPSILVLMTPGSSLRPISVSPFQGLSPSCLWTAPQDLIGSSDLTCAHLNSSGSGTAPWALPGPNLLWRAVSLAHAQTPPTGALGWCVCTWRCPACSLGPSAVFVWLVLCVSVMSLFCQLLRGVLKPPVLVVGLYFCFCLFDLILYF